MKTYRVTLDDHHCRPIEADDWREAVAIAIRRKFGPSAWSPNAVTSMVAGHTYADIYKPIRKRASFPTASARIASHVSIRFSEEQ